jgi:hypothetical protein
MNILTPDIKVTVNRSIIGNIKKNRFDRVRKNIPKVLDRLYGIVDKLVKDGDKNAYWIAYRACRNLVKKEPHKVMDLLGVDEYKYKDRYIKRDAHQED